MIVRMRKAQILAIDFDEVITSIAQPMLDLLHKQTGIQRNVSDITDYHRWDGCLGFDFQTIYDTFHKFYDRKTTLQCQPLEYVHEFLTWWHDQGNTAVIITARPSKCKNELHEYVTKYNLPGIIDIQCCDTYDETKKRSKGEVFDLVKADFFVEDDYTHASNVAVDHPDKTIFIITKFWNENIHDLPGNMVRVNNWQEIQNHLT